MTRLELLINIIGSGVVLLAAAVLLCACVIAFAKRCDE